MEIELPELGSERCRLVRLVYVMSSITRSRLPEDKPIAHQVHYRLVMKEVARPLYDILDINHELGILDSLIDVVIALAKLHWVHRDLSVPNVFSYNSSLKLGDLEFAKKFGSLPAGSPDHDFRTVGTRMFWAIEVENSKYLHRPKDDSWVPQDVVIDDTQDLSKWRLTFWHSPLHDCESIWWMSLWIFALRVVRDADSDGKRGDQREQLNTAFPRGFRTASRISFFQEDGLLFEVFGSFEKRLARTQIGIDNIRKLLGKAFRRSERLLPDGGIDEAAWEQHNVLHRAMKHQMELLRDQTCQLWFNHDPETVGTTSGILHATWAN